MSQALVGFFVDFARQAGAQPPRQVVGHIAKEIRVLEAEGFDPNLLEAAIELLVDKGLDPSQLASCVFTVQRDPVRRLPAAQRAKVAAYIAEHGYPTGWRFRRGSHSGGCVEDALGHDHAPPWADGGKPTRLEIHRALEQRDRLAAACDGDQEAADVVRLHQRRETPSDSKGIVG